MAAKKSGSYGYIFILRVIMATFHGYKNHVLGSSCGGWGVRTRQLCERMRFGNVKLVGLYQERRGKSLLSRLILLRQYRSRVTTAQRQ